MNPYSGDIERFSTKADVPKGWLHLTNAEADEFARLPNDIRLEHYIKNHHADKCGGCGCFVGNHTLRKFKECAANELARIDTAQIEAQADGLYKQIPARANMMDLRTALQREREKIQA